MVSVKDRTGGTGCSSAAAFVGEHPYQDTLEVYELWLGLREPVEANDRMEAGTYVEPSILDWYEDKQLDEGMRMSRPGRELEEDFRLYHADYPWIWYSPDALVENGYVRFPVDAKLSQARDYGKAFSDEVPPYVLCQMQLGMEVLRSHGLLNDPWADVCCLLRGVFTPYRIAFDDEISGAIVQAINKFKVEHIDREVPPEPQRLDSARQWWDEVSDGCLVATDRFIGDLREFLKWEQSEKEAKLAKDAAKLRLINQMGRCQTAVYGDSVITTNRKGKSGRRFNVTKLGRSLL